MSDPCHRSKPIIFRSTRAALLIGALALCAPMAQADDDSDAHGTAAEMRNEIGEALQAVAAYSAQERDEAIAAARTGLDRLDAEIARRQQALREDWSDMTEEARADASRAIGALQGARNRLGERLGALQAGTASAWDELQQGFAGAFDALSKAWNDEDASRAARDNSDG